MKIEEFTKMICEKLEVELSMCQIDYEKVQKNNGMEMNGIRISKKGSNISPTIYMENYYKEFKSGIDLDNIFEDIINCYLYAEEKRPLDIGEFNKFESVKDQIVYKLINLDKNKKMLEDTPYIAFLDLAIVFYYICNTNNNSRSTILIKENHAKLWEISKEELFEYSVINTPRILKASIRGMESIINEMMSEEGMEVFEKTKQDKNTEEVMYVLTNETGVYGAACILYHQVLEKFSKKIGKDFYILPSSIHEVILVPKKDEVKSNRLKCMVKEVNETEVCEEDILSNNVYYYSQKSHKFSIA